MTILHYSINDLLEARVKLPIEGKNINGRKIKVYIKNDDEKLKVAEFISMIPTFKIGSISIETETYMKSFKIKVIIELRDMTIFIKHQYQTHPNYLTKNNIIWI
ncbi:hypothetical protein [Photobacterium kishitanii]|uniref:hypothetical protein n=1 Tax=Photobacterium kishitanii TaxID=318456 RepID=UPI0007F91EBB|nr:hypothetical protein [Photobacterium kishitanii]OBU31455.1 hypothetical protein AYY23_19535 [Photobacterium kishitanii]PSW45342.1 hypothetical protein C0W66_22775 [Photobacterium kishitanii]